MEKRKNFFILGIALLMGSLTVLPTCLNPMEIDPDSNLTITGKLETTDVTAAVLMLTNLSKTVDVTKVTITQPGWAPPAGNTNAQPPAISFTNKPKRLEKKAQYLTPSDENYQVVIDYAYDAFKEGMSAGTGTQTINIPLPTSRGVEEVFLFRAAGTGDVVVHWEKDIQPAPQSDPHDTGVAKDDQLPGEGSSPAVILPENRTKMGTFVVVSKTNSQIIDNVSFKMGSTEYTMDKIGVHDKQSIALGQGSWETKLKYTRDGVAKTLGPLNSIVVPSNDPQAVQEHYLYFYLNKHGDYTISQTWPPSPNDAEEEDLLPPDSGYGRGIIKIINNSYALAESVTIHNLQDTTRLPQYLPYSQFTPAIPIQYHKTGYVDVVGSAEFPIDPHEGYLVQVTLKNNDDSSMVQRRVYLKDQVVTIVIEPSDLHFSSSHGAKMVLENRINSWPIQITGMIVRNKDNYTLSCEYHTGTWQPNGAIFKNQNAVQYVVSSTTMPIVPDAQFEALIFLYGSGISATATITKAISPADLYSDRSPDDNIRTITVSDTDVPDAIKDAYLRTKGAIVAIENQVSSWPVEVIGVTVQNKARTDEKSQYGMTTWDPPELISNQQTAIQLVMSSESMPITSDAEFEAVITLHSGGITDTITMDFSPPELYSDKPASQNPRTLTITDADVPNSIKEVYVYTRGAKVTLENKINTAWPVQVVSMEVRNVKKPSENTLYNTTTWEPKTLIDNNHSAVQMVMSSQAMPITQAAEFEAVIRLFGNGTAAEVVKPFSPAILYSSLDPAQNTRTITIAGTDVPDGLKPSGPPIVGATIVLENGTSSWDVQIIGLTIQNKARTDDNTSFGINNWFPKGLIEGGKSAAQEVLSSDLMPITATAEFEALVAISGGGVTETIKKAITPAQLYSTDPVSRNIRTITITNSDVPGSIKDAYVFTRGAKVTLQNRVKPEWPVQIVGMVVFNRATPIEQTTYTTATWEPHRSIANSQDAVQMVMSSQAMPIKPGIEFRAAIYLFGNGQYGASTRMFELSTLYSTLDPEQNAVTITINDSDIPLELQEVIAPPDPVSVGAKFTLKNNVSSLPVKIINLTVQNKSDTDKHNSYGASAWTPSGEIDRNNSATLDVLSTGAMPITATDKFEARVTLSGSGKIETITKTFSPEELYSTTPATNVRTITINDIDIPQSIKDAYLYSRGAKVTLVNNISAKWPVQIMSMVVRNKAKNSENTAYTTSTWEPHNVIGNGQRAVQLVMSSQTMPIKSGIEFEAVIYLFGNGRQGTVTKTFSPAELYSTLDPDQNVRTITISDGDIPDEVKTPEVAPVIGAKVTLENKVSSWPVQIMSMTVRNRTKTSEATVCDFTTWQPKNLIDNGNSAVQIFLSSTSMPITAGAEFEAVITLLGSGATGTVVKAFNPAALYSTLAPEQNTRTITITNTDVPDSIKDAYILTRGAKVTLQNNVKPEWPIQIIGMEVRNKAKTSENHSYNSGTWSPSGVINNNQSAAQMVMSSAAMKINPLVEYEAVITLFGNGSKTTVTKAFSPAALYSTLDPEQNTRNIAIGDSDIPEALQTIPRYDTGIPGLNGSTKEGDTVSIDGYKWYVSSIKVIGGNTYAMLVCKTIMAYGVVFNDPRDSSYDRSKLQAKMTELYNRMNQMKKIAVLANLGNNSPSYITQPTTTMADTKVIDVFFALTYRDVLELGDQAYKYGTSQYWTRSAITWESAYEVNCDGDIIGLAVTNATGIGAVPGVWVRIE
jgi:hypothetical protein